MKAEKSLEESLKDLKKQTKTGSFMPIFYTVVYGLGTISVFILPDIELLNKIITITSFTLIITVIWIFHNKSRRNDKLLHQEIDIVINNLDADVVDNEDTLTDEQYDAFQKVTRSMLKNLTAFYLLLAITTILITISDILPLTIPMIISSIIVFAVATIMSFVAVAIQYKKVRVLSNTISDEENDHQE